MLKQHPEDINFFYNFVYFWHKLRRKLLFNITNVQIFQFNESEGKVWLTATAGNFVIYFLLVFTDVTACEIWRNSHYELWVPYEWPYVMSLGVQWKWCFTDYESYHLICFVFYNLQAEKGHNLHIYYINYCI